jgi:hypothetical protein
VMKISRCKAVRNGSNLETGGNEGELIKVPPTVSCQDDQIEEPYAEVSGGRYNFRPE